jgi:hypothetical protein
MFRMRSTLKLSFMASLLSAVVIGGLMVAVSGSPAVAASKGVTCPDNTTGVTDGAWTIVCAGQTAAGATVTITKAGTNTLDLKAKSSSTSTFQSASASFNDSGASFSATLGSAGTNQTISVTVTNSGGSPDSATATGHIDAHLFYFVERRSS